MTSSAEESGYDDVHPKDLTIIPFFLPPNPQRQEPREADESENGNSATTIHNCKRKSRRAAHIDSMAEQQKLGKRIILSSTKPSYIQRLRSDKLRSQHRGILRKLLHKLVNQENWVEASGVLSVYLRATVKEMSPFENQFKFSVLLTLHKHVENSKIKPRRIKNIYDVWMRKNGRMKDEQVKNRYAVHLASILFFMMQGNIEEAYQAVLWLKQENESDHDSISNMVMGLILYELWYSCIPKEFHFSSQEELDSWLFPLHIPDHKSFENSILMHNKLLKKYYKDSVRYLQMALDSTPSAFAALLPLIQLLLIGGQVDEALNILDKQCCTSVSALPFTLKAILLERFNPNNSLLLASCFEDRLKKDPTCCESLAKLVKMHQDGSYSVESLVEMIASHLDATNAEHDKWELYASCFSNSAFLSSTPKLFTKKSWSDRCRWWLNKHFSPEILKSEIDAGDLQLLTYKAACASYMYGKEFHYVVGTNSHLEKKDPDSLRILDDHGQKSYGLHK